MTDFLFIGPYNDITRALVNILDMEVDIETIQFDQPSELDQTSDWFSLPITNFHDLTVQIMDIKPHKVIYFPPMLDYHRCESFTEDAYLSNEEAVDHIREVLMVLNANLIMFSSDLVLSSFDCILANSIALGEEIARSYNKASIIRLSPFKEQVALKEGDDRVQLLDSGTFSSTMAMIIDKLHNETYNMAGDEYFGSLDQPVAYIDDRKLRNLMK